MNNRDAAGRFVGRKFELVNERWSGTKWSDKTYPVEILAFHETNMVVLSGGLISLQGYGKVYDDLERMYKFVREVKA